MLNRFRVYILQVATLVVNLDDECEIKLSGHSFKDESQ